MMEIKTGCAGYRYYRPPEGWKKKYEQKLQAYADNFPLIEVNSTFYKLPRISTAEKWKRLADEVNEDFVFTLKANQRITHPPTSPTYDKADLEIEKGTEENYGYFKPTDEVFHAWKQTKEICEALDAVVCLFQTPASFTPTETHLSNLREFFSKVSGNFSLAFEPRGEEWTTGILKEIEAVDIAFAIDPFKWPPLQTGDVAYFRLHGLGSRKYKYKFTNQDLKELYKKCEKVDKETNYVIFNNYEMFNDCQRFMQFIREGNLPLTPWGAEAVVEEIDIEYPTSKEDILSKCGRWWVWVAPDNSIRVKEALKSVEKENFTGKEELLQAIESANPDLDS